MTIWSMFYKLFVGPLELLFEVIYALVYRHLHNAGLSIIFLSLAVNFLILPLYRRADAMQKEEQDLEKKMDPWVRHIKATFTGDERFMMLQTFYRQNNYKPSYVLRSSISLLLQIPFFTAAYNFLSGLMLLRGTSFGPITDLGSPDSLLTLGGVTLNILPILMTLINFISAAIYLHGAPPKNKLMTYGMAIVFLFLLYNSPSGLAFYWLLNNIFSMCKNIVSRIPFTSKSLRIGAIILAVAGLAGLNAALIMSSGGSVRTLLFITAGIFILYGLVFSLSNLKDIKQIITDVHPDRHLFLLCCFLMTLLTGVLIPSSVLESATEDFININAYYSPLWYLLSTLLLAAGSFMIWFGIYYRLSVPAGKKLMEISMCCLSFCSVINYMFFGTDRGLLSPYLEYEITPKDTTQQVIINTVILFEIILMIFILRKRQSRLFKYAAAVICLTAGVMSLRNTVVICQQLPFLYQQAIESAANRPKITLSKNGKNVVILMMDRAIGYYVPFIMEERPDVRAQFEGFTYYPNTLSFANKTNGGLPPIYGGYEYTPALMNKRSTEPLADKHNEALLMMPVLFHKAGYEVTVIDPSYAGYKIIPNLRIYKNYPYVHAYHMDGMFMTDESKLAAIKSRERSFFCFSIYKSAPLFIQPMLYTGGMYNDPDALAETKGTGSSKQKIDSLYEASGIGEVYERSLSTLVNIPDVTSITDTDINTYTTLDNTTPHQPHLLQMPDYTLSEIVDNRPYESDPITRHSLLGDTVIMGTTNQVTHYHINMSTFMQLGKWMDFLRENGVYDNTRIIVVSDHGRDQGYDRFMFGKKSFEDILFFNPILLVKDFNSDHEFEIDQTFMTNADVPTLAMAGIIDNPVNPATGNPVSNEAKSEPIHEVERVEESRIFVNNGYVFIPTEWYAFHGNNIFNRDSWEFLGIR